MSPEITRKRFIAGARCPGCGGVDKIYVLDTENGRSRQCVDCDFVEVQAPDTKKSRAAPLPLIVGKVGPDDPPSA